MSDKPSKEAKQIIKQLCREHPDIDEDVYALAIDALTAAKDAEIVTLRATISRWEEIMHEELGCTMQITSALGCTKAVEDGVAVMDAQLGAIKALRAELDALLAEVRAWRRNYTARTELADISIHCAATDAAIPELKETTNGGS